MYTSLWTVLLLIINGNDGTMQTAHYKDGKSNRQFYFVVLIMVFCLRVSIDSPWGTYWGRRIPWPCCWFQSRGAAG